MKFPIVKLEPANYIFGTKKILIKLLNDKIVVRVGTGFLPLQEFMEAYYSREMNTILDRAEEQGVTVEEVIERIALQIKTASLFQRSTWQS